MVPISRLDVDSKRPSPILVTGVPRSGTTWVARTIANAQGVSLPGREPMNPRGRQHGLAGTLQGWARLTEATPEQAKALRACYRGWDPRAFSQYGTRRWAAPLPWTRVVVKDPFAVLSIRAVTEATDAIPVVVYRHPAAVLASYRRMGWSADYAEVSSLPEFEHLAGRGYEEGLDDVDAMAEFWRFCYKAALADLDVVSGAVIVAHGELAGGGPAAVQSFATSLGLTMPSDAASHRASSSGQSGRSTLHNFNREPSGVADEWRNQVSDAEVERIETRTADVLSQLNEARLRVIPRRGERQGDTT